MSRYGGFVHRIKFGHKIEEEKKNESNDSWYSRARYDDSDSDSYSSDSSSSSSDSSSSSSSDSSWD